MRLVSKTSDQTRQRGHTLSMYVCMYVRMYVCLPGSNSRPNVSEGYTPLLSTCPLHTKSGCGKERHILESFNDSRGRGYDDSVPG